jgi:hypothetical protein
VVVTATNDHGQVFVSELPFSVGPSERKAMLVRGGSAIALVGAALLLAWKLSLFPKSWTRKNLG